MQKAAGLAGGDFFLFTDADINHEPRTLATALAEMERLNLDFLSLFPRMDTVSLWENIIVPTFVGGIGDAKRLRESRMLRRPRHLAPARSSSSALLCFAQSAASSRFAVKWSTTSSWHDWSSPEDSESVFSVPRLTVPSTFGSTRIAATRSGGMTKNVLIGIKGRLWLAPFVMVLPIFVFWTPIYCAISGVIREKR